MDRPLPNDLRYPHLGILLPKAVYTREHRTRDGKIDIYNHGYAGRVCFYIFCGINSSSYLHHLDSGHALSLLDHFITLN